MVLTRSRAALCFAAVVGAAAAASSADAPAPPPAFAIAGCRVVTAAGPEIASGIVVVRGGRIESVGAWDGGAAPAGVEAIDAKGKVLLPGFVHPACRIGLRDEPGGEDTADAARTAATELNPWLPGNAWAAASGFTTLGLLPGRGIVGGRGVAVRTAATSIESMLRREDAFLRVDVSTHGRFAPTLSTSLAEARKEVDALARYDRELAEWKTAKTKAEAEKKAVPKEPDKPKTEASREPWRKVLLGETALCATVGSSAEARLLAGALGDERTRGTKLRLYAICGGESYRAAGDLADLGAVCLVRAGVAFWPNTLDRVCPAEVFRAAGCRVILLPRDDGREGLRDLPAALAATVRAGLPRDEAFRAVTAGPAEMLGLASEIGTIEKDRRADLVLFSGDPLLPASRIERVWIDGALVEETP